MSRPVLIFLALIAVAMVPVSPLWGQSTSSKEIDALIGELRDGDSNAQGRAARALSEMGAPAVPSLLGVVSAGPRTARVKAARALGYIGRLAAPAVPTLTAVLDEVGDFRNDGVRPEAAWALGKIGPQAASAVPALTMALYDDDSRVRPKAAEALERIGVDLKQLWWVVPRAYWKVLTGLLCAWMAWFAILARFPKHQPAGKLRRGAVFVFVATPPLILACAVVGYIITRPWTKVLLSDLPMLQSPLPVAVVLSLGFCAVLASGWVCWRKPVAAEGDAGEHEPVLKFSFAGAIVAAVPFALLGGAHEASVTAHFTRPLWILLMGLLGGSFGALVGAFTFLLARTVRSGLGRLRNLGSQPKK
jgi:hypothetical protein